MNDTPTTATPDAQQMLALLRDAFAEVDEALESGELGQAAAARLDALRDRLAGFLEPLTPDSDNAPAMRPEGSA